ncbi:MAG: hypothetical protein ACKN9D_11455 [Actinomycetales bacterium]
MEAKMGWSKACRSWLAVGLGATAVIAATVAAPPSSAADPVKPVAVAGQYLSLAGSKLTLRGPDRLLLPVTLPKFTIPNLPDGTATKPAAVVQFRWRLCKRPLIADATEVSCVLMATPTQADGRRAYANVNVNFRNVNGVWEADPVSVPYQPRNMANMGIGMYLSPLALVAAVKANDPNGPYVGTTEFLGNPAANGVEISAYPASPFDTRTIRLTTDKLSYAPTDTITYTATIPGANFSFIGGTDVYSLLTRRLSLVVCKDPVGAAWAAATIQTQLGALNAQVRQERDAVPVCLESVRLPSAGLGTDVAPWTVTPLGVTGNIPASSLLAQPLEPGGSTTVNLTLQSAVALSQSPQVANASPDRFIWTQASLTPSAPVTIAVPANGQRVDAELDPNAQAPVDGVGQGSADAGASGAAGDAVAVPPGVAAVGGTIEEAGVDLVRAPLASETGSAKSGPQALSVKISKKPKVGRIITVTGTLTPKAQGEMTLALAYTIEGKEVVVRVRSLPVTGTKTPVKWKLQSTSPKGKYQIYASYLPTDVSKKGLTVSKAVTLK